MKRGLSQEVKLQLKAEVYGACRAAGRPGHPDTCDCKSLAACVTRHGDFGFSAEMFHHAIEDIVLEDRGPLDRYLADPERVWREGRGLYIWGADIGIGKQHPVDTKVLTPSGWRAIGTLAVGDSVIGSDGMPTQVKGVFPQGVKPSYRVRFSDGSSVEAGPDHLWTVAYRTNGRQRWQEIVVTTSQLRDRPPIKMDWPDHFPTKTTRDLSKTTLFLPLLSGPVMFAAAQEPLPIQPYLLGQLIANGSLSHGTPQLVTGLVDWPCVLKSMVAAGVTLSAVHVYGSVVHASVPGVVGQVRKLGLDVLSGEKFIPAQYLMAGPGDRIALLHGLMDADGSVSTSGNRLSYHTTSRQLADDVRELVECLGGIASVRIHDRTHEDKGVDYSVRVRLPIGILPFSIQRKAEKYTPGKAGSHTAPVRTVASVEYIRDVESVCIQVEAADQLYAVEHAILTHNTTLAHLVVRHLHRWLFFSGSPNHAASAAFPFSDFASALLNGYRGWYMLSGDMADRAHWKGRDGFVEDFYDWLDEDEKKVDVFTSTLLVIDELGRENRDSKARTEAGREMLEQMLRERQNARAVTLLVGHDSPDSIVSRYGRHIESLMARMTVVQVSIRNRDRRRSPQGAR